MEVEVKTGRCCQSNGRAHLEGVESLHALSLEPPGVETDAGGGGRGRGKSKGAEGDVGSRLDGISGVSPADAHISGVGAGGNAASEAVHPVNHAGRVGDLFPGRKGHRRKAAESEGRPGTGKSHH